MENLLISVSNDGVLKIHQEVTAGRLREIGQQLIMAADQIVIRPEERPKDNNEQVLHIPNR